MVNPKAIALAVAALVGTTVAAAAGYKLVWLRVFPPAAVEAAPNASCDLQQTPCQAAIPGGGKVTLSITPRPIQATTQLRLEVGTAGLDAKEVQVDISGVDMNMGINRFTLSAEGDGRFRGDAMLPACISRHMTWEAKVMAETARGLVVIPYRFVTTGRQ